MICQVSVLLLRIVFDNASAGWPSACTIAGIVYEFDALGRRYTSSRLHKELTDVVLLAAVSFVLADTSAVRSGKTRVRSCAREVIGARTKFANNWIMEICKFSVERVIKSVRVKVWKFCESPVDAVTRDYILTWQQCLAVSLKRGLAEDRILQAAFKRFTNSWEEECIAASTIPMTRLAAAVFVSS